MNILKNPYFLWALIGLNTGLLLVSVLLKNTDLILVSLGSILLCYIGTIPLEKGDNNKEQE